MPASVLDLLRRPRYLGTEIGQNQAAARLRREPGALARHLLPGQVDRDELVYRHRRDQDREIGAASVYLGGKPARRIVAPNIGDALVAGLQPEPIAEHDPLNDGVIHP